MKLPLHLLILDMIGCLFIGLGMTMHFADVDLLPANLRFENDGIVYILIGVACMIPAIIFMINGLRNRHR
ncbi:DUF1418 family protein [Gilvimarinus polysaccharolyticus]|uniref:DUF1418 family protein n=1 Tax=Gilvimarinus polysaccharolyticus TaxID=863921 RepID=UPI00067398FF|nr:DUF1418 family protein [Gilvimarinus polysaccharolyticus]